MIDDIAYCRPCRVGETVEQYSRDMFMKDTVTCTVLLQIFRMCIRGGRYLYAMGMYLTSLNAASIIVHSENLQLWFPSLLSS